MVSCIFPLSRMGEPVPTVCDMDRWLAIMSDDALFCFNRLIARRRALPVYRGHYWACYECKFVSDNLSIMAAHILESHTPAPLR
jgi:hypothetical protein